MWNKEVKRTKVGQKVFDMLLDQFNETDTLVSNQRHVAAIVYKGDVLSIGKCQYKTHPLVKRHSWHPERIYLHAEVDAIIKASNMHGNKILGKCELYVMRVNKHNETCLSKPCIDCQKIISAFGINKVYWT